MSDKQFEECDLEEATHVEMGGKVYKLGYNYGSNQVLRRNSHNIEVHRLTDAHWQLIHVFAFPFLGIKPLKEVKPEPIEFEAVFAEYNGKWHPSYSFSLDDGNYQNCKKAIFKCVQIVEED
jgi:hypothetical protein